MKQLALAFGALIVVIALFSWMQTTSYKNLFHLSLATPISMSNVVSGEAVISVTADGFQPEIVTITKNTKVVWLNKSGKESTINSGQTVNSKDYPPLNLGPVMNNQTVSLVFPTSGTYHYHNNITPTQQGTIVVE